MPQIRYRKLTEDEAKRVREILELPADYTKNSLSINDVSGEQIEAIKLMLKVDQYMAGDIIQMILRKERYMGSSLRPMGNDTSQREITVVTIGNSQDPGETVTTGDVVAHEIGHSESYADPKVQSILQSNPLMNEMVAIYYARQTAHNEDLFQRSIAKMREHYNRIKALRPKMLHGRSFESLMQDAENATRSKFRDARTVRYTTQVKPRHKSRRKLETPQGIRGVG